MNKKQAKHFLGCQIWVEPTDTKERVEALVKEAANAGLGWLRTFLMWPWIEAEPGNWDFRVFDDLFDACQKHGILVKATLTANSGPWHIGTPSLLHSHTGFLDPNRQDAVEKYVAQCVDRYKDHPALGQWILWNEPQNAYEKTDQVLRLWQEWLKKEYNNDLAPLNRRWRTGYSRFDEIPFGDEVAGRAPSSWRSYRPELDSARFRCTWLQYEIETIARLVRKSDQKTDLCINPTNTLGNQIGATIDLDGLGRLVDVMGASYHPGWHFMFAERCTFPGLMASGVKQKASHPSIDRVEVTEVQCGNTLASAIVPRMAEPTELARFFLSGLFAGAESVTGWLLNTRSYDFEAGDWGLLDDGDGPSERTDMMRRVHGCIARVIDRAGAWKPVQPRAWVGIDPDSQTVDLADYGSHGRPGIAADDAPFGAALLNIRLMQSGVDSSLQRLKDMPSDGKDGGLIVLSNIVAWEEETANLLLAFVHSGGTLLFDATCGRKTTDAALHRPWPGGIAARTGLRAAGLETNPSGYDISLFGQPAGKWILTRMRPVFQPDGGWNAWEEIRYDADGEPCVWERDFGAGKIVFVNGLIGPSLVHEPTAGMVTDFILHKISAPAVQSIRPIPGGHSAFSLNNQCDNGRLTAILADSRLARGGKMLRFAAPPGRYEELWTGQSLEVAATGEAALPAEDGIVVLWQE